MNLRTIKLPKTDPHVLAFQKGRYDGITSRVRWLLTDYRNYVNPFGDKVYDEILGISERFDVDVRRTIWAILKNNSDFLSMDIELRIAAKGALSILLMSKQFSSGFSGDPISATLDLLEKQTFPDRNNPPFRGDSEGTFQSLTSFARWARQVLAYDIKVGWNVKATQAQKDVKNIYSATYSVEISNPEDYILWDVQEGLREIRTPFAPFGARVRSLLKDQLRWLLRLNFAAPRKMGPETPQQTRRTVA